MRKSMKINVICTVGAHNHRQFCTPPSLWLNHWGTTSTCISPPATHMGSEKPGPSGPELHAPCMSRQVRIVPTCSIDMSRSSIVATNRYLMLRKNKLFVTIRWGQEKVKVKTRTIPAIVVIYRYINSSLFYAFTQCDIEITRQLDHPRSPANRFRS